MPKNDLMEKIVSLCKRRGFIFPGSEIYGGLANSYDFGPLGVELKNNIKQLWWERFVHRRDDVVGIDSTLIMNPKVWEASGHVATFSDPLVDCKNCKLRYRANELGFPDTKRQEINEAFLVPNCPNCGKRDWTIPRQFNLMFDTFIGTVDPVNTLYQYWFDLKRAIRDQNTDKIQELNKEIESFFENELRNSLTYLRPETAQGMFVDFKTIIETSRLKIPFGIAQIGKAFRNEITPGNFVFRTREFEMMEIEYFIPKPKSEKDWQKCFKYWREEMRRWLQEIGINLNHIHELDVPEEERAHYSKKTIDFQYDFPFKCDELYGLAYRTDFDLRQHEKFSGQNLKYKDPQTGKEFWPHVIEPTWGVDRSVLAILCEAYDNSDKDRVVLKLPPKLAPYKVAVFPLLANKAALVKLARKIYNDLRQHFMTAWDDRGNIGKRYYAQDEIGTPYCITVDFQSLEDRTVTIRNRDTTKQERVGTSELKNYFEKKLS